MREGNQPSSESLIASRCWEGERDGKEMMVVAWLPLPLDITSNDVLSGGGSTNNQPTNLLLLLLRPVTGRRYHHSSRSLWKRTFGELGK